MRASRHGRDRDDDPHAIAGVRAGRRAGDGQAWRCIRSARRHHRRLDARRAAVVQHRSRRARARGRRRNGSPTTRCCAGSVADGNTRPVLTGVGEARSGQGARAAAQHGAWASLSSVTFASQDSRFTDIVAHRGGLRCCGSMRPISASFLRASADIGRAPNDRARHALRLVLIAPQPPPMRQAGSPSHPTRLRSSGYRWRACGSALGPRRILGEARAPRRCGAARPDRRAALARRRTASC